NQRILLAGPDGTEKIFHTELFWWLNTFLTDRASVYAQPSGLGQDSTDIMIITITGGSHLIEVKWLGENEHTPAYRQPQINAGLIQVKVYLEKDNKILSGDLVIYDGRERSLHDSQSKYSKRNLHSRCNHPYILFLESQTPSQIAAKSSRVRNPK